MITVILIYLLKELYQLQPSASDADANNTNIKVQNGLLFEKCIIEINNTQTDNVQGIDVVIPMYSLLEYSNNYSKTSGSLVQYCKDEPVLNNSSATVDFINENSNDSFKF